MSKQGIASIGMKVTVNKTEMNYVQEIGDIGGTPSELDATCLKDTMKKNVPGVQDTKSFEVTYLFDNSAADSDYRRHFRRLAAQWMWKWNFRTEPNFPPAAM